MAERFLLSWAAGIGLSPYLTHVSMSFCFAIATSLLLGSGVAAVKRLGYRNSGLLAFIFALIFVCLLFGFAAYYKETLVLVVFLCLWSIYFAVYAVVAFCMSQKSQGMDFTVATVGISIVTFAFVELISGHGSVLLELAKLSPVVIPVLTAFLTKKSAAKPSDKKETA